MKDIIMTSYNDEEYYVVSKEDCCIFYLLTILSEKNCGELDVKVSTVLSHYWGILREGWNKNLFIPKESDLGQILTNAIKMKKENDEQIMIRKEILVNAFLKIMENQEFSEKGIQQNIENLIREGKESTIESFQNYNPKVLKEIIKIGRSHQSYLEKFNPKLTGFEEEGLLEKDGNWYQFNIITKEKILLDQNKKLQRKKSN